MASAGAAFRSAIEARDIDAAVALFAEDGVFRSPAVHRPYSGPAIGAVLHAAFQTFEDFRYTDEASGPDGLHLLVFAARVGDKEVEGLDLLRPTADGQQIAELTVMVRPLRGLEALVAAMAARLPPAS